MAKPLKERGGNELKHARLLRVRRGGSARGTRVTLEFRDSQMSWRLILNVTSERGYVLQSDSHLCAVNTGLPRVGQLQLCRFTKPCETGKSVEAASSYYAHTVVYVGIRDCLRSYVVKMRLVAPLTAEHDVSKPSILFLP